MYEKLRLILGGETHAVTNEILKTCYLVALKVNRANIITNTADDHSINCSLI